MEDHDRFMEHWFEGEAYWIVPELPAGKSCAGCEGNDRKDSTPDRTAKAHRLCCNTPCARRIAIRAEDLDRYKATYAAALLTGEVPEDGGLIQSTKE